jgi:hypothetical protein
LIEAEGTGIDRLEEPLRATCLPNGCNAGLAGMGRVGWVAALQRRVRESDEAVLAPCCCASSSAADEIGEH